MPSPPDPDDPVEALIQQLEGLVADDGGLDEALQQLIPLIPRRQGHLVVQAKSTLDQETDSTAARQRVNSLLSRVVATGLFRAGA